MSLPGTRPSGKKGEAPDRGAIHRPVWVETNTHTPRSGVVGKDLEGESRRRGWRVAVKATGAHSLRPSRPTPRASGPQQRARVPAGSYRPRTRAGDFHRPASETRRRRRFPAGAARRRGLGAGSPPCCLTVPRSSQVQAGSHHCCPWLGRMGQNRQVF